MAAATPSAPDASRPVHPLIDAYLDHLRVERRLSAHTLDSYARDLGQLARFAAGHERAITDVTRQDLEAFVRDLMGAGFAPRSVARTVAATRGFFRYLGIARHRPDNPADDLQAPRVWSTLPKYLSTEDVDRLLAAPDVATARGLRDRALIEVVYATGLRVSELVGLRMNDLHLDAGVRDLHGEGQQGSSRADWR